MEKQRRSGMTAGPWLAPWRMHTRPFSPSVCSILSSPLQHAFVPRLSATAAEEYVRWPLLSCGWSGPH
jgi:hypothetical protein